MKSLLLIASLLICPEVQVINKSDSWTDQDKKNVEVGKRGCELKFKDQPCLIAFIKTKSDKYKFICGKKVEKKDGQ